ncbi:MAG: site-specific integrase, partial [Actinobacteria bacterium]|nr:site-specific integrase [Actinomycetota bacterium]
MSRAATGSIRKLPSGRWQVRYTAPDGVRRSAPRPFLTKRDANAWLARTVADISRGQWTAAGSQGAVAVSFSDYSAK